MFKRVLDILGAGPRIGGADSSGSDGATLDTDESYKGYRVEAHPNQEGSGWQVAGRIRSEDDADTREHSFVRADIVSSWDEAVAVSLQKGRQLVDDYGDAVLERG